MGKTILLFAFAAMVLTLGGCKKTCTFPQEQTSIGCTDVREKYYGFYHGTVDGIIYNETPVHMSQDDQWGIRQGSDSDKANMIVNGYRSWFDAQGNITIPNQFHYQSLYKPYHIMGSGFVRDTIIDSIQTKLLFLQLTETPDSTKDQVITCTFTGVR